MSNSQELPAGVPEPVADECWQSLQKLEVEDRCSWSHEHGFLAGYALGAQRAAEARQAEVESLRAALKEAATSLTTVARLSGRHAYPDGTETHMGTVEEVRDYAASRARVAHAAIAASKE